MRLAGLEILEDFIEEHAAAAKPLNRWRNVVAGADWRTPHDIKQSFRSTDFISNSHAIFNIGGNNIRLVARVIFQYGVCRMKWIGTHAEYDKVAWKKGVSS